MRLVFCGTPHFALPALEALPRAGHAVALVISQPDRPVGRTAEVALTPVKQAALRLGLPVVQPTKLKSNEELRAQMEAIAPDAIVVVAYGRILPQWMLDLSPFGCLNGHASLLPRWRGAAPIQWAIASGDTVTGVTTMRLDAGLDTGPMLLKRDVPITPATTSPDLFVSLAQMGAALMVETLAGLQEGTIGPEPQDDSHATLAPILTRDDGRIDWTRSAAEIERRFRAFQPWPGAWTTLRGKKLIVHAMQVAEGEAAGVPGAVVVSNGLFHVGCGSGTRIALNEVQVEGKRRMPASEFLRGMQIHSGESLGERKHPV